MVNTRINVCCFTPSIFIEYQVSTRHDVRCSAAADGFNEFEIFI